MRGIGQKWLTIVTKIVTIYYAPESACMYVMVCA